MYGVNTIKVDYLIIGQGLAGTLLAWQLLARDKAVIIVDDNHHGSSSLVAAGLVNPLAGKRFALPENTTAWLESAIKNYRLLEQQLGIALWHPIDMLRQLHASDQQRHLDGLYDDPRRAAYIDPRLKTSPGAFLQTRTGYLDMPALINGLASRWRSRGILITGNIDHADFTISGEAIAWQGISAGRVIFCEGWRGQNNPWFDWLPFTPVKGEILTVESRDPIPDKIINGAHWLLPLSGNQFRFGSTYEHENLDTRPTPEGKARLLQGIHAILPDHHNIRIVDHQAGVRPATTDRKPFIGMHPEHPAMGICNGFGSRGALLAPWYTRQFVAHLEEQQPLPEASRIDRWS